MRLAFIIVSMLTLGACSSWPPLPCPADSELLRTDESLLEKRRSRSHVNRCSYQPGRYHHRSPIRE